MSMRLLFTFPFLAAALPLAAWAAPALPDGRIILPPPPAAHSAAQHEDDAVFQETRHLAGSARWRMALNDADLHPQHLLADFSCAAGVTLDANRLPRLMALIAHLQPAIEQSVTDEKQYWKRKRPFVGNDLPICTDDRAHLGDSPAYPSGHTTHGWIVASILAEIMPDRATEILHRGRVFGESRIVCGVHWKSDVQAGWINGGAMFAALQADSQFQADLLAARQEVAALRARPQVPDAARCAADSQTASQPIE